MSFLPTTATSKFKFDVTLRYGSTEMGSNFTILLDTINDDDSNQDRHLHPPKHFRWGRPEPTQDFRGRSQGSGKAFAWHETRQRPSVLSDV